MSSPAPSDAVSQRLSEVEKRLTRFEGEYARLKDEYEKLERHMDTTMRVATVPIVTAIMYKTMFKILTGQEKKKLDYNTIVSTEIHKKVLDLSSTGFLSEEEMVEFADTYVAVAPVSGIAGHSATGDDVIRFLPWMDESVRTIITYGFPVIFGCSIRDWDSASELQKQKQIRF